MSLQAVKFNLLLKEVFLRWLVLLLRINCHTLLFPSICCIVHDVVLIGTRKVLVDVLFSDNCDNVGHVWIRIWMHITSYEEIKMSSEFNFGLKFTSLHMWQEKLCKFSVHINCNRLSKVCMDKSWNKYKLLVNNDKHNLQCICLIYQPSIADLSNSYPIEHYFANYIFVFNFPSGGLEV